MSEVQSRGSSIRGRGGFRGGRGGYRGSRGAKSHSKSDDHETGPPLEDQGEVGELKARYAAKLPLLREVAEGWSDEDLVFALQETNGDEAAALDRITSGSISQWGEVKKKPAKSKDSTTGSAEATSRGRGRGGLETRGRGRATDRGGRGGRGAKASTQTNGTKHADKNAKSAEDGSEEIVVPTNGDDTANEGDWANDPGKDKLDSLQTDQPKPAAGASGQRGGWASLFAKPTPPPAPKKEAGRTPVSHAEPVQASAPHVAEPVTGPDETVAGTMHVPPPIEPILVEDGPSELPSAPHSDTGASDLTPGKDALTEKNVHKLPDVSHPPQTATAASTAASTQDPLNPALPPASAIRPGMSGHAASALRATAGGGRSASFNRKVMEQQEAVIMPGNHAVDRAAVQFGKMGLNGDDIDADEDREEPETRTQLLDDSPAAPRASLPPSMHEAQNPMQTLAEPPTEPQAQRAAPGLTAAPQQPSPQQGAAYADQYRYGQGQKPYDPFSQQPQHPHAANEPFSNQLPGQGQSQTQIPTSAQQDYAQYYAREYSQYYGGYGQASDGQRAGSAVGSSAQDVQAQYATAGPRGYAQQELSASGHNTPNPSVGGHQAQPSQHLQQGPASHAAYPYAGYGSGYASAYPQYGGYAGNHRYGSNRPMFDDVRRQEDFYNSQYGYGHNQGYGSSYKSNMYGGPQHQYSHEYSSSPANTGFGGREAGYGRSGSTQPSDSQQNPSAGSNAFAGGMPDPFGRTSSGFGQSQHGSHGGSEDPAKPTGPSPSLQGNRPGSAVNTNPGQQGGLPHPQSGQQAFGAYPQYGGFGNQNTHNTGYGAYGSNNAFGGYGGYGRGWTGNYGSGQH